MIAVGEHLGLVGQIGAAAVDDRGRRQIPMFNAWNPDPVGNNELARLAGVSDSTASAFFSEKFQGHTKYRALCPDTGKLAAALKLLNGEFAPYLLYGGRPAREDD